MSLIRMAVKNSLTSVACSLALMGVVMARADEPTAATFDIASQNLAEGLSEFARQSQQPLLFAPEIVAEKRTDGVKGRLETAAALRELLKGTGLTFSTTKNGAILIGKPRAALQLGEGEDKDAWPGFLLAQTSQGRSLNDSSQDEKASASSTEPARLEEVVVTARRREERSQTVPIAITAVSQQTLQNNNVQTLGDLQFLVPSMSTTTGSYTRDSINISIRGQGSNRTGGAPGVVVYLNEVPIPGGGGLAGELAGGPGLMFDLESVEVVRGPQGTLFGKNSVGGAMLLRSARPGQEFGGRIQVGYGNYNNREVDGAVNLPLASDVLLARVAFNAQKRDGYTHLLRSPSHPNGVDADNRDYWSARASLTFRPSARFQNDLALTYQRFDSNGSPQMITEFAPDGLLATVEPRFVTAAQQQLALGPRTSVPVNIDYVSSGHLFSLNNISSFELTDHVTLRNIFGYGNANSIVTFQVDGTEYPLWESLIEPTDKPRQQLTEEIQLLGKAFDSKLDWIVGGFYFDEEIDRSVVAVRFLNARHDSESSSNGDSKALFAQGAYDLSTRVPNLSLTAGLRYTWDKYHNSIRGGAPGTVCVEPRIDCSGPFTETGGEKNALTWTFGLDYRLTPDTLLYFASRRGYRVGGANATATLPPFGPEYVNDFELGTKSDWSVGNIPVRTNVAVFLQNYKSIQVQQVLVNPPAILTANAASARLWGAEFEGQVQLTERLHAGATFTYLNFATSTLAPGVDPAQLEVGRTFNRPPYKYTLDALYRLPINAALGDMSVQARWAWQDTTGDRFLAIGGLTPAYGLLNLSANWNGVAGKPLDLSLYASNALNKTYNVGGLGAMQLLGLSTSRFSEPRMYGVRVRYNFGAN